MIVGAHNHLIVQAIEASEWRFHLVGSRFVGVHNDRSDWDFLCECGWEEATRGKLDSWLTELGFKRTSMGYGPDPRLHAIFQWKDPKSLHPGVDIFAGSPEVVAFRLKVHGLIKAQGDKRGGLFCRALKSEQAWPTLWDILAKLEAS